MAGYTRNKDGTYSVNYNDERFKSVEKEKNQKLQQSTQMHDDMISSSDKFYEDQINASKEWADKQSEIQQKKTDFLVEQTEQQKEKAERDYTREQKGAYTDYMKQTNDYSAQAEQLAANGLQNSGYSESSRVSMWNTYQNRYATAREGFNQAILNYNNSIKEALLANDEVLAQISYQALQQQLELSLQGFQYKNTLLQTKQQELDQINENYYNRYQNVLAQINAEIDRQMQKDKIDQEYELALKELNEKIRQSNLEHDRWMKEFKTKNAQWQKEWALKEKEADRNYQLALAEERRAEAAYNASKSSYSGGGSSGSYSVNSGNTSKNSGNKTSSQKGLSSNAQKIWQDYLKSKKLDRSFKVKENTRQRIAQQVKSGKISNADAEQLFNMIGV